MVGQAPLLTGWSALYYVPVGTYDEAQAGIDINHDGDRTDVFDIGQIHRRSWSTSDPASADSREVPIGPSVVLQEHCRYGSDLDGDGFGQQGYTDEILPMDHGRRALLVDGRLTLVLWDPVSGRLHLRLFVLGRSKQGWPTVRRVESMVFLRNSGGV